MTGERWQLDSSAEACTVQVDPQPFAQAVGEACRAPTEPCHVSDRRVRERTELVEVPTAAERRADPTEPHLCDLIVGDRRRERRRQAVAERAAHGVVTTSDGSVRRAAQLQLASPALEARRPVRPPLVAEIDATRRTRHPTATSSTPPTRTPDRHRRSVARSRAGGRSAPPRRRDGARTRSTMQSINASSRPRRTSNGSGSARPSPIPMITTGSEPGRQPAAMAPSSRSTSTAVASPRVVARSAVERTPATSPAASSNTGTVRTVFSSYDPPWMDLHARLMTRTPQPDDDVRWAASGAMAITGGTDPTWPPAGLMAYLVALEGELAESSARFGARVRLDAVALLGERAAVAGLTRRGRTSCGGSTQLLRSYG